MSRRFAQSPRFDFSSVEQEGILYNTETHEVIHLDARAVMVWSLCDGERTQEDIATMIGAAYPGADVANDVAQTLTKLCDSQVIVAQS